MPDSSRKNQGADLRNVVEKALPKLRVLSAVLDTYGGRDNAESLRNILAQLEGALPARPADPGSTDFVVNATFRITRMQVANLLCVGLASSSKRTSYSVVEMAEPPELAFRVHKSLILRYLDYPLNAGGSLGIALSRPDPAIRRLDLSSLARGLEEMATKYPRHFADFVNENTDEITADVYLQCCLFGEVVYE
jgi:hypothetical protein